MVGPILVFDSGIGGLSVFDHIHSQLPQHDIYYLFDNARLPYGDLNEQELIHGCVELIVRQVKAIRASIVVVACNSASTLVLPELRKQLDIPVVGVVPAIKPAALISVTRHIGLLATPGTVTRQYTQDLIDSFASDCKVTLVGTSDLVLIAEAKAQRKTVDINQIEKILAPIKATDIDTLVLGCTHFPLLQQEIDQVLQQKVMLLDSGDAVAARVLSFIEANEEQFITKKGNLQAGFTKDIDLGLEMTLADYGFTQLQRITVAN
ncbi:glutamate racemase [Shewanella sp. 1_MG-2023]|uniref:glutamate racemase n=1 Tax=unclassified Shewanella TaxID=196818 RepID=UPI0026E33955|nr:MULTISPECIES: glutamate racemase [unclassified Shewanella]MDO6612831.1 glutamate racemase [Shewanella sp. 7_MG-2023]MDO6772792.1 glutamate racemase [Shewanella sp. 2_MG-2023]MDO6794956.1 glutamate racemase [Shewanella sp. 1_MG-2023]